MLLPRDIFENHNRPLPFTSADGVRHHEPDRAAECLFPFRVRDEVFPVRDEVRSVRSLLNSAAHAGI